MKTHILLLAAALVASPVLADAPAFQKDLMKTVHAATKENKMAFILLGREACGNCQATKKMVREGTIPVTADAFVAGDLNIDDNRVQADFMRKFAKEKFGSTLPFIVITDSHGKALASSSGYKSPEAWKTMIEEAKKKIAAKGGAAAR